MTGEVGTVLTSQPIPRHSVVLVFNYLMEFPMTTKNDAKTDTLETKAIKGSEPAAGTHEAWQEPKPDFARSSHNGPVVKDKINIDDKQDMELGKTDDLYEITLTKGYRPKGFYQTIDEDGIWHEPATQVGGDNGSAHQMDPGTVIRVGKEEANELIAADIGYSRHPIK